MLITTPNLPKRRTGNAFAAIAACVLCMVSPAQSVRTPSQPPPGPPVRWAEAAAGTEIAVMNYSPTQALRYRVHRQDAKGKVTRQIIESRDGSVARLLARDGQPLTPAEDAAERDRLHEILQDPSAFQRHVRRENGSRAYAEELLRAMPAAMLWTYVPDQPQLPSAAGHAVVLDFEPNPKYKPSSLVTEALTGIAGRLWVDERTHVMTRMEGRVLRPVNFGWGGVLARVRAGGTVELDQQQAPNGRWLFAHMVERITIREVLVHTVEEDTEMFATDVQPLPAPISVQQAVQELLAMPIATR